MSILVKTAEQIEFAEIFERLEKAFNISQSQVARALRVERSYISMLVKGKRTPRIRTLEDMRDLEKSMQAAQIAASGETEAAGKGESASRLNRILLQLSELERTDPATFAVAARMIESLAPVSSKPASAASRLLNKAAAGVSKPDSK